MFWETVGDDDEGLSNDEANCSPYHRNGGCQRRVRVSLVRCSRRLRPSQRGAECLFEGGENADVGLAVTLVFGPRAVIAEKGFDALGEVGGLLTIDTDDERRAFAVGIVDDQREFVELVGVAVVAKELGSEVCEIGE